MVSLVARWIRWGFLLGVLGATSGCIPPASLSGILQAEMLTSLESLDGSENGGDERPQPPDVHDSGPVGDEPSPDGEDADGNEADESPDVGGDTPDPDDGGSEEEPQEEPEDPPSENNAPVAQAQILGAQVNNGLAIALSATDPDEDPLTYSVVDAPNHGTIVGTPPNVTYVPDDDYIGFDSLTFQADDGWSGGVSNVADVRIWVIDEQDLSGHTVSGSLAPGDTDIWSFQGVVGERVAIRVSYGWPSARLVLYSPAGGDPETATSNRRIDWRLQNTGRYTVAVENPWQVSIGYNLSVLVLGGQLASLADLDGGPIDPGETMAGQLAPSGDMDAYTFEGIAGQRVLITISKGWPSAGFVLYPPGGGEREASSSNLKIDRTLEATGLYTIVVETDFSPTIGYNLTLQQF